MAHENGSMKLSRQETEMAGFVFIRPDTHIELFRHCASGRDAVYEHEFKRQIKPLLMAHGVKEFKVD